MWGLFTSWWTYIIGFGALGLVFLSIYFYPFLQPILKFLEPVFGKFGEIFADMLGWFWDGLKDIADNMKTIFTVALIVGASVWWFKPTYNVENCKPVIEQLRKDYKFVKRTATEKRQINGSWFSWLGF